MTVEALLETAYWVIDPLPMQVPEDSPGCYFAVERFLLQGQQRTALTRQIVRLLLKLNCYVRFTLFRPDTEQTREAPSPSALAAAVTACLNGKSEAAGLYLLMPDEDAMLTLWRDDLGLTLYHPSDRLLQLVRALAGAEGLFVWQPEDAAEGA